MPILNVVLALPLRKHFDYLADDATHARDILPGTRVLVPFGKNRNKVGLVIKVSDDSSLPVSKLKKILSVIDEEPVLGKKEMELFLWAANYYQHPSGEVIFNALPARLRQGKPAAIKNETKWCLTRKGCETNSEVLKRAPRQKAIFDFLQGRDRPAGIEEIAESIEKPLAGLKALREKNLVEKKDVQFVREKIPQLEKVSLNAEQKSAAKKVSAAFQTDAVFLLDGVTSSGKTEVYIEVIQAVVKTGKQALVLCPEIGLTPQLVRRIASSVDVPVSVLHSGLNDSERLKGWLDAKSGEASVVIGTRSAVWVPLKNPGLIVVDEEHDISYKQQDGFRYSARDIAIMRGSLQNTPVILGSATPSMESLRNVRDGRFAHLILSKRASAGSLPLTKVIDLRNRPMQGAVSKPLINAIKDCLNTGQQALLFLNRRGYSPTLMCHECAHIMKCERCDKNFTFHKKKQKLSCHHCDRQLNVPETCPSCATDELVQIGHGTERLEETLQGIFPDARVLRIDRDSTRKKGSMEVMLENITSGDADILIGTQMLAKGHHFPKLALVGIIDTDGGLCSEDFRASERMAQLFIQVSGRAGRENSNGTVYLQTHFPDHPLLKTLIEKGYGDFSNALLEERKISRLPPYSYMAILRAECRQVYFARDFLDKARALLVNSQPDAEIYGPYPSALEKKAGMSRLQLLVLADKRKQLRRAIMHWSTGLETMKEAKKVRWSIDIDPQEVI